jgi:hypothetical protein
MVYVFDMTHEKRPALSPETAEAQISYSLPAWIRARGTSRGPTLYLLYITLTLCCFRVRRWSATPHTLTWLKISYPSRKRLPEAKAMRGRSERVVLRSARERGRPEWEHNPHLRFTCKVSRGDLRCAPVSVSAVFR